MERLRSGARGLAGALGDRAMAWLRDRVEGAAGRLTQYAEGGAARPHGRGHRGEEPGRGQIPAARLLGAGMAGAKEKVKGIFGRRGKGGQKKLKLTNIVESIDVGVPVRAAYNQRTQAGSR